MSREDEISVEAVELGRVQGATSWIYCMGGDVLYKHGELTNVPETLVKETSTGALKCFRVEGKKKEAYVALQQ